MDFDPLEFLNFAKSLVVYKRKYQHQAAFRTITDRAYYATFLYTREKLKPMGCPFSEDSKEHKQAVDYLMNHDHSIEASILAQLRRKRNDANYNLTLPHHKDDSKTNIRLSERLIEMIERI